MTSQQLADHLLQEHQARRNRGMSENGEPRTPKEIAECKAERAIRDAWLAVSEACSLHKDPLARPVIERQFDDIKSMRTKLDFLASAVEVSLENRSAA